MTNHGWHLPNLIIYFQYTELVESGITKEMIKEYWHLLCQGSRGRRKAGSLVVCSSQEPQREPRAYGAKDSGKDVCCLHLLSGVSLTGCHLQWATQDGWVLGLKILEFTVPASYPTGNPRHELRDKIRSPSLALASPNTRQQLLLKDMKPWQTDNPLKKMAPKKEAELTSLIKKILCSWLSFSFDWFWITLQYTEMKTEDVGKWQTKNEKLAF